MALGASCCVVNCTNARHTSKGQRKSESLSFFRIPKVKTREGEHVRAVTERRRRAWVAAIRRTNITFEHISDGLRVCSRHFHRGKPAYEMAETDPDWAPSLYLGHEEFKQTDLGCHEQLKERTLQKHASLEQKELEVANKVGGSSTTLKDSDCLADGVEEEMLHEQSVQGEACITRSADPGDTPEKAQKSITMEGDDPTECKVEIIKQIVVIEDDVVDLWHTVGASRGLTTDVDVCRFLLSLYLSDGQDATHGVRCGQCNSILTLVCVTCQRPSQGPSQQSMSSQIQSISSNAPFLTSELPSNSKEVSITQILSESERDGDSDGCLDMQVFDSEDSDVEMTFEQAKKGQNSEKMVEKDPASATSQPTVQSKSLSEKNRHSKTAFVMLHKCDMQSDPSGVKSSYGKGRQTSGMKRRGLVQGSIQTADKLSTVSGQRCPKQQDSSADTQRESSADTHRKSSADTHRESTTEQGGTSQPAEAEQVLVLNVSRFGPWLEPVEEKVRPVQQCTVPSCLYETNRSYDMKRHMTKHDKYGPQWLSTKKVVGPLQHCIVPACSFATTRSYDMKKHMGKHVAKAVKPEAVKPRVVHVPIKPGPKVSSAREKVKRLRCSVPGCPYATNWTRDMKFHMKKHDKLGPQLKLVEKKAKPIQQCKVPSCAFETDRNFDMKIHMARHDKHGPQWRSGRKKVMPVQHCCVAACSFSTTKSCDMQRHMERHDKEAASLDIPKKPDPIDSPAPENLDAGHSSALEDPAACYSSAPGNLDTSNPSASGNLDLSNPSAPEKRAVSHSRDHVKLVRNELSVEVNLDHSFSNEHISHDPVDFSAQEKPDPSDFSAFDNLDPSDLSGQVIFDLSDFGVEVKPEPGDSSAQEKPGASAQEKSESSATSSHEKSESSAISSQEKPESSATSSHEKPESSATSSHEKPESSATSSHEKPESSDSSLQEKSESSATSSHEKPESSDSSSQEKPESRYSSLQEKSESSATSSQEKHERHMERHTNKARQEGSPKPFWIPHVERSYRKGCRVLHCRVGDCTHICYASIYNMLKHMRSKHPSVTDKMKMPLRTKKQLGQTPISHLCDQCGRAYITPSGLTAHKKKVHMGKFRYQCDKCAIRFFHKTRFSEHMLQHEDVTCSVCGETLPGKKELQLHMKTTHPPLTLLACEQEGCQATFSTNSELTQHMKQTHHIKPERLACKEEGCQATFSANSELTKHMKQTHPIKPERLACKEEGCQATFSLKSDLTRHIRSKHKGMNFVCPVCGLKLSYTFTLTRHVRKCHNMTVTTQRSCAKKKQ